MPLPVRPHRDPAPGTERDHVIFEVVSANADNDPQLEFLPEQLGDAHLNESVFIIEPVPSAPSRRVAQRLPLDEMLDREHVPADIGLFQSLPRRIASRWTRPHFLRVLEPRTRLLAVRRRATATLLAAHGGVTGTLLALRGGAVGTYGVARRMTSQLAHWTWRSGARVLEGITSIGASGVSRIRRFDGDVRTRGHAFGRLCGAATMLSRVRLTKSIGAIERVMLMVGRHVSLAARSLREGSGAALRALVHHMRVPSRQRLAMQIPLPLDISRVRLPASANATLLAFTGGTALGACIMWLVGVLPPPPGLTASGVTRASGVIAPGPPANDHTTIGYSATPVTDRVERQEEAPASVSSPVAVIPTAITVTSAPAGAHVTVDGIGWGGTPVTIRHLPLGEKVIRVTKDGYESEQQTISVADDHRSAAVRVTLRARKLGQSDLRLSTDPPVLQTGTPESAKNPGT